MWWGYARNQNKKNKKTQMNANNKQKYSAFICVHLRFLFLLTPVAGMARSYNRALRCFDLMATNHQNRMALAVRHKTMAGLLGKSARVEITRPDT
jgi:hypothetical protein